MSPAPPAAIQTAGLTKRFRSGQVAVDRIDLEVPSGAVYGFLGPNGSGKTTTIRMLLGLVVPTSGTHQLLGEAMPASGPRVLPRVGALVEGPAFHPYLGGAANLRRLDAADATVDPRTTDRRVRAALEQVGLTVAADKSYRTYSLGMRQRLGIAAALLRPRELLVLDEPTNGLDPQGTREVRHLIAGLGAEGITVLVSSHLLGEVEQMCSHVGVMAAGRLVWQGPLTELAAGQRRRARVTTPDVGVATAVYERLGLTETRAQGHEVTAALGAQAPEAVVAALVAADVRVRAFGVERPSLEDVFVGLTGEGFDVSG